ncbi:ATP-binding protein [Moraxella sp. ZJ142]|uniref:ATP-binding protein n=1 Tax=Moraxella marmotae TaxID=3344520 RepID=UPI0035D4F12C
MTDLLYFNRTELAKRLLISLKDGIAHALTLFAPRRMGKTAFLLHDIEPMAKEMGFHVFYFSFMNDNQLNIENEFKGSLLNFLYHIQPSKHLNSIKRVDVLGVGVERSDLQQTHTSVVEVINLIAKSNKPTLFLLDEAQELARLKNTDGLVRALRTGLDINKSKIKTIFTGSSTNGLRSMFHDNKAPFFEFAHALDFPNLTKDFTDHLVKIYESRTGENMDNDALFSIFQKLQYNPMHTRTIVQNMIINPNLNLSTAYQERLAEINRNQNHIGKWQALSELEKQILILVGTGETSLYSNKTRETLAQRLGVETLTNSSIQGKVRKLINMDYLTRNADGALCVNDDNLVSWIKLSIL